MLGRLGPLMGGAHVACRFKEMLMSHVSDICLCRMLN